MGPSHGELGRGTAEGGDERAQVQEHAYPAGSHLDPEDGPAPAEEAFNVGTFVVEPVGDGHHHIEGSQEEHKVEIGIGVDGALLLIVNDPRALFHILLLFGVSSSGAPYRPCRASELDLVVDVKHEYKMQAHRRLVPSPATKFLSLYRS